MGHHDMELRVVAQLELELTKLASSPVWRDNKDNCPIGERSIIVILALSLNWRTGHASLEQARLAQPVEGEPEDWPEEIRLV